MGEKHDAMWGVEAGERIAQLEAELARLRAEVEEAKYANAHLQAARDSLRAEVERLQTSITEAWNALPSYGDNQKARYILNAALAPDGKGGADRRKE